MSQNWWVDAAQHAAKHENSKFAGVVLIIIGFFFAPFLIGIPIMAFGIYKLFM